MTYSHLLKELESLNSSLVFPLLLWEITSIQITHGESMDHSII